MDNVEKVPGLETPDRSVGDFESDVLTRLLEEVRNNQIAAAGAYNRQHNRHNR